MPAYVGPMLDSSKMIFELGLTELDCADWNRVHRFAKQPSELRGLGFAADPSQT